MSTPPFVSFNDAETAYKYFLGQDWFRKLRDDLDNLNQRLLPLEKVVRIFDDFTTDDDSADGGARGLSFDVYEHDAPGTFGDATYGVGKNWIYIGRDAVDSWQNGNAQKPAYSVGRMTADAIGTHHRTAWSRIALNFNMATRPLIFEGRYKCSADLSLYAGMRQGVYSGAAGLPSTDRNGIWVERVDGTNWRFVSYDGARQNGSNFAKPTIGNWFVVRIEFTDTPSNRALCYVDGVLKETITAHLPTSTDVRAMYGCLCGTPGNFDFDSVEFNCQGLAQAA